MIFDGIGWIETAKVQNQQPVASNILNILNKPV